MARPLATVRGTMLTPGVSRNGRLYTKELIAKAVSRMQERIADPNGLPIVMRTHHEAGDNSALIVGRVTQVDLDERGAANYTARLYDTGPARDIAGLVVGDQPALKSVSIHGYWLSKPKTLTFEGQRVTTADDLEIDAVDFTASPGVTGAVVTQASYVSDDATNESADGRYAVTESMEAELTVDETVDDAEIAGWIGEKYNAAQRKAMAARGQAMKDGSYPIANKADLRKAIRAVGRGGADHDAIRRHIMNRARALGLSDMIPPDWKSSGKTKESRHAGPAEHYVMVCVGDESGDMLKVKAENLHPDVVKQAIKKAGALVGNIMGREATRLNTVDADDMVDDPNDIDFHIVTGIPSGDVEGSQIPDDDSQETATGTPDASTSETSPSIQDVESEESVVPDETKNEAVAQAAPTTGLTEADITKIGAVIGESIKQAMLAMAEQQAATKAAKKKAAKESKKNDAQTKATESAERTKAAGAEVKESGISAAELKEQLAKELKAELREEILKENGLPARKGFRHVAESDTDATPTGDELWNKRMDVWSQLLPMNSGTYSAPTPVPVATADSAES